jgi:putative ABC transport system substrate-binding protein
MTAVGRHWLVGILLATIAVASVAAEPRVLIVREESVVAQQTAELLARELSSTGWAVAEATTMDDRSFAGHAEGEQALIALGSRAFSSALKHSRGKPIIGALLARGSLDFVAPERGDHWSAILLDQPIDRWINLINAAFPGVQQIGMLASPVGQKAAIAVERRLMERGLTLTIERVATLEDVVPAIERLVPHMDVLLAMPDPFAHNRNTVQPLLLTTYRAGIPVVAYSESYQHAGAVIALYSTIPQIVAQIVDSMRRIQDGKTLPNVQMPRYFTVGVNRAVARSLGLSLPPAEDIEGRLRGLGQ